MLRIERQRLFQEEPCLFRETDLATDQAEIHQDLAVGRVLPQ